MKRRDGAILGELTRLGARDLLLRAAFTGSRDVEPPTDKAAALADAARVLATARVTYMLVGGVAVAVHTGIPRATLDTDLAVRSDSDRDALAKAFRSAGFTVKGRHEHTLNLRHRSGEPVQLAFDPLFDDAIARAESFRVGAVEVRIARREDLIALKERAASDPRRRKSKALRDRADVEMLRGDVPGPDEGW